MHQHTLTPIHGAPTPAAMPAPMPSCPNCGTVISCGCQRARASDGTDVCDECVMEYEKSLRGLVD